MVKTLEAALMTLARAWTEAEEPPSPTHSSPHPYHNPASGLHKASSHPTAVQPAVILAKVHSLGNLVWGCLLLECVWPEPRVPAQTAGSAGAPRRLTAKGTRNPQPPTVPENGMCCWGIAGRSWGHGELGKVGALATRPALFC